MNRPDNPQFPHWCRIVRYASSLPSDDSPNVSDVDTDIIDDFFDEEENGTEPVESKPKAEGVNVIYEGACRAYNRDTISDNGDVIASYRNLSLPVAQKEWLGENIPQEGDYIEVFKYGFKENGEVIDKRPGNLGTHILWKFNRN